MDGLGWCEKCRPPRVFDPRTVYPVANRYIDYAVPENDKHASRKSVFIRKNVPSGENGAKIAFISLHVGRI
jgi:hypothetical protein